MTQSRRLAAILAADVAEYSRLMGADEEGTHERLKAHLAQLVEPKIEAHRGRTVKNTGDGLLAEFGSVVDAVRCAVEIQRGMVDREPEIGPCGQSRLPLGSVRGLRSCPHARSLDCSIACCGRGRS
jgi:class 3 adenylate cyclase